MSGAINGWMCDTCGQTTYVVHVDEGVTPMFLACRAEGLDPGNATCKGTGKSLMYPSSPPPQHVIAAVRWEWYAPDARELAVLRRAEPETYEHVEKGGVLLRGLTNAGRDALALPRVDEAPGLAQTHELPERRRALRVGRNEPCPCGSDLKFKRCCGV